MLSWKKISAGVYNATSPWGLYTIDGHGYGRNRWTVTYPDGDYGMVDSLGEAKAWAEQDAEARTKRQTAHAIKKPKKRSKMRCPNCDGGLRLEDPSYGLTCPRCEIRVAGPFESAHEIPDYVPATADWTTRRK